MNFIDKSADFLAKSIRNNYPDAGSEVALRYALSLLINTLIAIVVTLLISYVSGHVKQAFLSIGIFILIRYISGGLHLSSSVSCCMLTITVFLIAAHASFPYLYLGLILDVISMSIFYKTAPNGIENVSSINPKYYPLLKFLSIALVSLNFIVQSPVISAALFMQAVLTTQPAYTIRDYIERRLLK